ncbi:MAG TPA: hypothetical protein VN085_04730 [Vicinamibacterales bacterium]|nr:hypothetical protein [Vicinamibacterales bacterium]
MPRKDSGKLGGLVRRKLVREIALKPPDVTYSQLAKKYGVSGASITEFRQRHAEEIAAVAAAADDEFAGILIANKAYRLAALQEMHEIALTPQPKVGNNGKIVTRWNPETGEDEEVMEVDVRAAALVSKQAAEELGHLANRVTLSGQLDTTTTYKIVNVSDDDLT